MFEAGFLTAYLTFWLGLMVCLISPGPDFALVVRNSLLYSRRLGIFTALGTTAGLTFHASYTLIGVGVLIKNSPWGFTAMKVIGACYLIYLGWKSFKTEMVIQPKEELEKEGAMITPFQAFRMGFLTDALNPMGMVFFLTMFALVMDTNVSTPVKATYLATTFVSAFSWFAFVAMCFSLERVRLTFARMGHWLGRVTGGVLLGLGLRLAFLINP